MSETAKLSVQTRTGSGSRVAAKLRKQGLIPGVVYGHKQPVAHITVKSDDLNRAIRVLHARTFALDLEGKSETVLIKELQWNHLGDEMLHVDFERHDLSETVRVVIPIELRNAPKATGGGVLDQPLHRLHVECTLANIPEAVRVDITNLTLGNPIYVRDLTLSEGVKATDAADAIVVHLKVPGAEAVVAEAGGVEPEVLTAKKPKEGEDDAKK